MRYLIFGTILFSADANAMKILFNLNGEQRLVDVGKGGDVTKDAAILWNEGVDGLVPLDFDRSAIGAYEVCQVLRRKSLCVNSELKKVLDERRASDEKRAADKAAQDAADQIALVPILSKIDSETPLSPAEQAKALKILKNNGVLK